MNAFHISLLGALILPSVAYSRQTPDSRATPEVTVQQSQAASIRTPQLLKINDLTVLRGGVVRSAGYSAAGGAHVDATLKDSRGRTLAVLDHRVAFNRHPVTRWHRKSHFALSWSASAYPSLDSVSVRYVAKSHVGCGSSRGEP
jgi:hypothetical protein